MREIDIKDRIRGSLIGGAIGDALGYPIEFMNYNQIINKYGPNGITRYELNEKNIAEISDDTQMTLFTANGLLFGYTRLALRGIMGNCASYISDSYLEWLQTQTGEIDYTKPHYNWIRDIKELHALRAPGNTCLQALHEIAKHNEVKNNSKGCGGIMRIAPIPLYYSAAMKRFHSFPKELIYDAGEVAKITHKHPLGYLPAALLSYLLGSLVAIELPTSYQIANILNDGIIILKEMYPAEVEYIKVLQYLMGKAARRAVSPLSDAVAIKQLGEGWVAEETLAIAVFCAIRYPDNFEKAVIASVNHSGDSDSTGAVTGNIMGAICGYDAIPTYFKENLELRWLIEEMADDLADGIPVGEYGDCYDTPQKRRWMDKYVDIITKDHVPIKNSYMVDRNLNIYAGEYPGDKDNEKCRMKVGVGGYWNDFSHFFDLTEYGELNPYCQFLESRKVHHRFPIPDCGIPSSTLSVRRLIEEIIYCGEQGKVYIHCWGGVGRTGTIVACLYAYLMKDSGLSYDAIYDRAMQQLKDSFSKCPKSKYRSTPDTQEQCEFIKEFIRKECN